MHNTKISTTSTDTNKCKYKYTNTNTNTITNSIILNNIISMESNTPSYCKSRPPHSSQRPFILNIK